MRRPLRVKHSLRMGLAVGADASRLEARLTEEIPLRVDGAPLWKVRSREPGPGDTGILREGMIPLRSPGAQPAPAVQGELQKAFIDAMREGRALFGPSDRLPPPGPQRLPHLVEHLRDVSRFRLDVPEAELVRLRDTFLEPLDLPSDVVVGAGIRRTLQQGGREIIIGSMDLEHLYGVLHQLGLPRALRDALGLEDVKPLPSEGLRPPVGRPAWTMGLSKVTHNVRDWGAEGEDIFDAITRAPDRSPNVVVSLKNAVYGQGFYASPGDVGLISHGQQRPLMVQLQVDPWAQSIPLVGGDFRQNNPRDLIFWNRDALTLAPFPPDVSLRELFDRFAKEPFREHEHALEDRLLRLAAPRAALLAPTEQKALFDFVRESLPRTGSSGTWNERDGAMLRAWLKLFPPARHADPEQRAQSLEWLVGQFERPFGNIPKFGHAELAKEFLGSDPALTASAEGADAVIRVIDTLLKRSAGKFDGHVASTLAAALPEDLASVSSKLRAAVPAWIDQLVQPERADSFGLDTPIAELLGRDLDFSNESLAKWIDAIRVRPPLNGFREAARIRSLLVTSPFAGRAELAEPIRRALESVLDEDASRFSRDPKVVLAKAEAIARPELLQNPGLRESLHAHHQHWAAQHPLDYTDLVLTRDDTVRLLSAQGQLEGLMRAVVSSGDLAAIHVLQRRVLSRPVFGETPLFERTRANTLELIREARQA